ncbi:MAG: Rrf2 family transcriptional regulator [Gammaproteobacteria bacterium]|nr:Rrf2 family transcriptional regulator [Gammaproteobacteria bacterium]
MTREVDYAALRCLLVIARRGRAGTGEITETQDVPVSFLGKIVSALARAGIVVTRRGAGGGETLARSPTSITVLEVIQRPFTVNYCTGDPRSCDRSDDYALEPVRARAQRAMIEAFDVSFDDLLDGSTGMVA